MSFSDVFIPALLLFSLGCLFALLLGVLAKKLSVDRDPRIDEIKNLLSGANCGACGQAGCDAFASKLVEGAVSIDMCPSTSTENKNIIADILGVANDGEEMLIQVVCQGGNACMDKYMYQGYGDCRSMELLASGRKECPVGCMGMGSCVDVCHYHAIEIGENGYAVINHDKCVKCGACVNVCPKGLIKRIPKSAKVLVACSNTFRGKDVKAMCSAGCIGCGICAKNCPEGAITMVDNLPHIDYSKCTGCKVCVAKCPTKTIISLD